MRPNGKLTELVRQQLEQTAASLLQQQRGLGETTAGAGAAVGVELMKHAEDMRLYLREVQALVNTTKEAVDKYVAIYANV